MLANLAVGDELVQRRVEQTHGHGHAVHDCHRLLDVVLHRGEEFLQYLDAVLLIHAENHLAEQEERLGGTGRVEHVLGTEEADALGTEGARLLRVGRVIGIGADAHLAVLVNQRHETQELGVVRAGGRLDEGHLAAVGDALGAVHRHIVALAKEFLANLHGLVGSIHDHLGGTDDAGLAPAARNQRRVAGHAATCGQDAVGDLHALDVFGVGFFADQNDLLAQTVRLNGVLAGEENLTASGAGTGGQALDEGSGFGFGGRLDDGQEELEHLVRVDAQDRGLLVNEFLVEHVERHGDGGLAAALATAALQHEEFAFLDGELDVLHVVVVLLQGIPDFHQLLVGLGNEFLHRLDMLVLLRFRLLVQGIRRADAGDDVLALGVDEPFTEELVLAGGGVAGESHAGGGGVAHVAKDHGLDVDGGAPVVRNALDTAVGDGLFANPGLEDGTNAAPQLLDRVIGEIDAENLLDLALEGIGKRLKVGRVQFRVGLVALEVLVAVQHLVEQFADALAIDGVNALGLLHDDVGVHHNESAVGVPDEARVLGLLDETGDGRGRQTNVEHGIHHARHGLAGTGAAGDQQRVLRVAILAAHRLLHIAHRGFDLGLQAWRELAIVSKIIVTAFRGDGEARRHRQTQTAHLSQVGTLATQQVPHLGIAFGAIASKAIHILDFRIALLHCSLG